MLETHLFIFNDLKIASKHILSALSNALDINTVFVAVNDKVTNYVLSAYNRQEKMVVEGEVLFEEAYCSLVEENEQNNVLIITDTTDNPLTKKMKPTAHIGNVTYIGIPIKLKDGTIVGTICGMDRKKKAFSQTDIKLLKSIAAFLSSVTELEHMAFHDPLTNVFSRSYLEAFFKDGWKNKYKKIGFLFFDLDYFKAINDQHDHSVGDIVLKEIASRIKAVLGKNNILCRLGGDEFLALVLNYKDNAALSKIIESIQCAVSKPLNIPDGKVSLSMSIGVSRYPEDGDDIQVLIKKADHAMYQVKNNGRNDYKYSPPTCLP
ncbi:sensor domain-containing diguanylate cyclase [Heyndrickxia ginsengihumi]|uniref:Sensor domain-containing diguanylate cyclase n=1 Tax=Heyndrickxia ginsengihumi TaxID=363870 RepID=A0A6M0PA09_9BACI|nr:sensor domain-containing diguanylate cyclase [Heyndrickxia ginsengihumi]MBE6184834.1 sensor domain-containing diguanylate cyclase [Bacillus sp. (in: firmicutes)]MCM3023992.1 sensor domain-containing diguanylate cyclase [Heyndrickxia ginsengihumi]NEY21253.1 sensor domain-containing diguanylate cyclase [Heyndrickxia ginsengihumi]